MWTALIIVFTLLLLLMLSSAAVRLSSCRKKPTNAFGRVVTIGFDIKIVENGRLQLIDSRAERVFSIADLKKLSITTTDQGPFIDDVFLTFYCCPETVFLLPSTHPDYSAAYEALSQSFSLDYEKYMEAMTCTENAEFIIWQAGHNNE